MEIDRQRVKAAFVAYTSQYDIADEKIKLKIDHTYRVAGLCQRIARSLSLSERDVDLAWLLGMLHDVGRFEQLRRYGTFSDAASIDHAHFAAEILFDGGKLGEYVDVPSSQEDGQRAGDEREIIYAAIWNHSAYRLEEGLDQRTRMFCDILRDADKVDILKVNQEVSLEVIYNVSAEKLRQEEVTEAVMQEFFKRRTILRSMKKTCVDNLVGHAALVFELVYPESLRAVEEQGYLEKILHFSSDNPRTREQFVQLRACMADYLAEMRDQREMRGRRRKAEIENSPGRAQEE